MVGIVVTISPNFNLYRMVVLPAASNPTINILISFFPIIFSSALAKKPPMVRLVTGNLLVEKSKELLFDC